MQPSSTTVRPSALAASAAVISLLLVLRPGRTEEPPPAPSLTREQASAFARLALNGLGKEYPNKPEHVLAGLQDVKAPKALHPAFYGSYDWHSSVHGHWMLVRLLKVFPDLPESKEIRSVLARHLTAPNILAEADYLARKESKPFERPYGWAWLLKLAEELNGWDDRDAKTWAQNLARWQMRSSPATWNSSPSRRTRSGPESTPIRRSGSRSRTTTPGRPGTRRS